MLQAAARPDDAADELTPERRRALAAGCYDLALAVAGRLTGFDFRRGSPPPPRDEAARDGAILGLMVASRLYRAGAGVKFSTFAYTCCRREALKAMQALRMAKRAGAVTDTDLAASGAGSVAEQAFDRRPGPAERAERRELAARAWQALRRLPPFQREVVERRLGLRGGAGESGAAIALGRGISCSAANQAYRRGIDGLRAALLPAPAPARDWRPAARAAWAAGEADTAALARRHGVSRSAVYRALVGVVRRWP